MEKQDARDRVAYGFVVAAFVATVSVAGLVGVSPREGWWWDAVWLAQAQVAFNVIGAALAGGAVFYAWRVATKQFDMMREQDGVIRKQLQMMEEQASVSRRIEEVSKRQADIAQIQHEVLLKQLNLKSELKVEIEALAHRLDMVHDLYHCEYDILIRNSGDKAGSRIYWHLFLFPIADVTFRHKLAGSNEHRDSKVRVKIDGIWEIVNDIGGFYEHPIYPQQGEPCLRVSFSYKKGSEPGAPFTVGWFIESDIGKFPPEGFNHTTAPLLHSEMRMVD